MAKLAPPDPLNRRVPVLLAASALALAALSLLPPLLDAVRSGGGARRAPATPPPGLSQDEPIQPLPEHVAVDEKRAALGRKLFHDPRLSRDGRTTCVSCHRWEAGGADTVRFSTGSGGATGAINAPTVFNVAFSFRYNWNGVAGSLEEHAALPMKNASVMGLPPEEAAARLSADRELVAAFRAAYPDGLTPANLRSALAEYERTLVTPRGRFDRFLAGDASALSDREKRGWELFW